MTRFNPFEVTAPHIIYACLGAFVVLFGMFSLFLRSRLYIGEACWAFLFGVIIGPNCANIFDPRSWGGHSDEVTNMITLEVTRVVLAIGVFAIGVELPKAYMKKHWKSLFFLLGPVMTWGWFVSAGLIYALIPGLNFLSSLAIAACLTPTDPILAAAVVGGKWADKHVPAHLRHLLAAESGCNDGAAFPFLFIALYLTLDKDTGGAIRDWFLLLWLYQVVVGIIIGSLIGFGFRHLMKFCTRRDLIDRHSYVAQYVSLAMMTIGVCTLLGSDDLLAAFACGTAFAWDGFFNRQTEESVFSSVIDLLFNIAAFVYVGAWMPFSKFQDAELTLSVWRLIVIAVLVLLLRRLPIMVVLYRWIPDVKTFREAVFSGHFGPIGVGAVFISTLANEVIHKSGQAESNHQIEMLENTIEPIVAFMVLCSITVHGLSIPSFSLGRRVHSVSRTWSRREVSLSGGEPEWANQTRRVTRAEDVVVNRDHRDEKAEERRRRRASEVDEKTPISESSDETRVFEGGRGGDVEGRDIADATAEENLPDGDEVLSEWYEPHHKIVERRRGPGEDVEVTVTPLDPSVHPPRDEEEGGGGVPMSERGQIAEERDKWRHTEREFGRDVRHTEEDIRRGVHRAEEGVKDVEERVRHAVGGHHRVRSEDVPSGVVSDDGEEGWASEGSSGGEASASHPGQQSAGTGTPASRRPRQFEVHAPRRRNSSRRGSISSYLHSTTDDERGRDVVLHPGPSFRRATRTAAAPNARTGTGTGKNSRPGTSDSLRPPHLRVESLRGSRVNVGREASPARSVRFADEGSQRGSYDVSRGSVDGRGVGMGGAGSSSSPQLQTIFSPGVEDADAFISDSPVEEQEQASRFGNGNGSPGDSETTPSSSNSRSGTASTSNSRDGGRGRVGREEKT